LDRDGKFRNVIFTPSDPQIGTKPHPAANDGGKNARAIVAAVKAKDCKKLAPLISPQSQLASQGGVQAGCKSLVGGKVFAPSVAATKNLKPKLLGETKDIQFYGVPTNKTYFTMLMVTPPGTSDKPPLLF